MTDPFHDESVLRDRLSILSRQKWIVVLAVTMVPFVAAMASHRQQHLYQASATVLVNQQNATAEALNLNSSVSAPPDRYAATQALLARVPTVAAMAVNAAKVPGYPAPALLANSTVSADPLADLLTFAVTDPRPAVAIKLTNAYAQQFTRYRHQLDSAVLAAAIADAQRKINSLAASGRGASLLSRRLAATEGDLEELQALQASGSSAAAVGPAESAVLVQPRTKRNVLLGLIVGSALGIALAFVRESLDTRVRSAEEFQTRLGILLLGRVPRPDRRLAESGRMANGPSTEAFRILKNRLDMLQLEDRVRSIVITSPLEDEDRSPTAASLAVALAQSGRHVILADLNLREPTVHRLFGLDNLVGFTHVAEGSAGLTDALNVVYVHTDRSSASGVLAVVTAGHRPRDPGEFLLTTGVSEALAGLSERCDLLLIDTPPMLPVGDAMTIAKHADAVVLVAGVNRVRRETLVETRHVLDACPALKLGVIATDPHRAHRAGPPFTWMRRDDAERTKGVVTWLGRENGSRPAKTFLPSISARVGSTGAAHSARARRRRWDVPADARAAARGDRDDGSPEAPDA